MINIELEEKKMLIQNNLKTNELQAHRYVKEKYGVSEIVFCPRKSYFIRHNGDIPEPNGKMLTGTLFHTMIPIAVKNYPGITNPLFEQECKKEFTDEFGTYTITGHSDVIADEKVLEFKFTKLYKRKPIPEYWFNQVNIYAYFQNKDSYEIIAIDKDDLNIEILSGEKDQARYDDCIENAKLIWEGLNKGIAPEKGPMYSWECKYCPYEMQCKKERTDLAMKKMEE